MDRAHRAFRFLTASAFLSFYLCKGIRDPDTLFYIMERVLYDIKNLPGRSVLRRLLALHELLVKFRIEIIKVLFIKLGFYLFKGLSKSLKMHHFPGPQKL